MSDKPLDEQLMNLSEDIYRLAISVGKLQAENSSRQSLMSLIESKFKSGNDLDVERIVITRKEYENNS